MNTSNYTINTLPKLIGENKHYPPAVKEWSNSTFTYNKNLLKTIPSKDMMTTKIIKSYFNLSDSKHLARSIRMRALIKKLSTNRIFIGKPEIKQTNDYVNVTIYALDRERQLLLRKIYHNLRKWENTINIKGAPFINKFNSYDNWRDKYNLNISLKRIENNILDSRTSTFINKQILNINRRHYLKNNFNLFTMKKIRKNIFFTPINKKKNIKSIPYFGTKFINETKFLRHISQFKNNNIQARKRIYYSYLKNILFLLGIKILNFNMMDNNISGEENKKFTQYIQNDEKLVCKGKILLFFNTNKGYLNKPEVLYINNINENLPYVDKVNLILSCVVNKILNNNNIVKNENFSLANFSKINFENFLLKENAQSKLLKNKFRTKLDISAIKKEISLIKDYINLKINYFKFGRYLPALKLLISKIYNKNVKLNIVRLKYFYLNSDIFMDAIILKLRKKLTYSNIMDVSLKSIKIPNEFNEISNKVNNIHNLNVYKTLKLNSLAPTTKNKDNLELVLKNIYPLSLISQQSNNKNLIQEKSKRYGIVSSKLTDIINIVRYKWVTGVRLEIAGRLTRRYTASRSVHKYKNKGNLKNTDFSRRLDFLKKSMPAIMFRNSSKTNLQYTFIKSKKRIGAFGLKGWIGSY